MTRKEGCGVSIGTHAEEDEIKDGESGGIFLGKLSDELGLVVVA